MRSPDAILAQPRERKAYHLEVGHFECLDDTGSISLDSISNANVWVAREQQAQIRCAETRRLAVARWSAMGV